MWEGHNWLPVILQEANLGVLVATSSLQEWYAVSEKLKKVRPFAMRPIMDLDQGVMMVALLYCLATMPSLTRLRGQPSHGPLWNSS